MKNPDTAVVDVKMEDKHILFYNNIYFKTESSDISNSEKSKLDLLIKELKNNPSWTINSIGHTDSKGSVRYNQILSSLRSESVKTYLCNRGISYKRVHTIGKEKVFQSQRTLHQTDQTMLLEENRIGESNFKLLNKNASKTKHFKLHINY